MWKQPWGYAEGWAICAGLLITGFGLQLITGPVQAGLFQYPVNVAGGLIFLLVLCIGFVVGRKITVVQWFSGLTASITSLSALLSVVLVMGFVGPGIERITMSWPFVLLFLYFLFVLGFVTLKRIVSFRWRDVPFMLNHVGLFITLLAAILGNGDLRRLRMTVPLENPEWRASDEKNEMIELPLAIELRSFTIDEYPPKLMLIDNTTGKALPEKQPENILVEEIPLAGNLQGWKVEVTRSLPMAACVMGQDTINFVEFHSEGATTALYVKARNELTGRQKEGWVSCGSYIFPYISLQLDDAVSMVMPEREPRRFASDVMVYTKNKQTKEACIEVNKPLSIAGWKIYQLSYDETKGKWSRMSVFFCVSTDKAANPVNIMGASKRIMEDMIMAYTSRFKVTTARFANVAFSNGSLPNGWIHRVMKKQPLAAPNDVKRYFVSPEESGQICMLACVLGRNGEIFFPKLGEEQMLTFSSICDKYVESMGCQKKVFSSDEEAKHFAADMPFDNKEYPVVYFGSDTTGEKAYEEFYVPGERLNMDRFSSLGVIEEVQKRPLKEIDAFFVELESIFASPSFTKEEVVKAIQRFIPHFEHEEKGKNLDQKM